jgi:tRNA(Ile)-lysidine synthase
MRLEAVVKDFLARRSRADKPLVLGLSGGVDSLCLFHLLCNFRSFYSALHIAHVDHGWRQESKDEARMLKQLAERKGHPFHLHVIDKQSLKGNLEDVCREERIRFFLGVAEEAGAQAVVLGHHADDQAETVLKRVFEGAPLISLKGMASAAMRGQTPFWRPLLSVPKKDIVDYMKQNGSRWMDDSTNEDPAYLRARMRLKIIPFLTGEFGKNVSPSLCRLSNEIEELVDYLDFTTAPYQPLKIEGPFGVCYDFSARPPQAILEWKFLIRMCCRSEEFVIGREKLAVAAALLQTGAANKEIESGGNKIFVDRGRIFFLRPVKGEWKIETDRQAGDLKSDWRDIFRGMAGAAIPKGKCHMAPAKNNMVYRGSSTLGSWWSKHKVPLCVRGLAPVLIGQDQLLHEFLTGRSLHEGRQEQKVFLKFKKLCC